MRRIFNIKTIILLFSVIVMIVLILLASYIENSRNADFQEEKMIEHLQNINMKENSEEEMYEAYVKELCESDLWKERDAYDACTYLMLPMWYAFQTGEEEYIDLFTRYSNRFTEMYENMPMEFEDVVGVTRVQHLYFLSEYMSLCKMYGYEVSEDLFEIICAEMNTVIDTYAGSYKNSQGYQNMWEVLDGLLYGEGYGLGTSYDHVLTDNDMFPLAIMCDLIYVSDEFGEREKDSDILSEIKKAPVYVNQLMKKKVTNYEDGIWQFQVGEMTDSLGYEYAGIENADNIEEGKEYKVDDITSDSSHYTRMPLWLRSFQRAQDSIENGIPEYYDFLLEGLGKTVVKNILVKPDENCKYYRMNNYTNGLNGIYRYGYHEEGIGYGPYEVSSTFLAGWYTFCGNDEIREAFIYTADRFPLDEEGEKIYTDPVTVREQNPIFLMENYKQWLCSIAGRLKF